MKISHSPKRLWPRLLTQQTVFFGLIASVCQAQTLQMTPVNPSGVYDPGQPIAWNVSVTGDAALLKNPRYQIKLNGDQVIGEGTLDLAQPNLRIETKALAQPATLLAELSADGPDQKTIRALGGAVVEAGKIEPVVTRPADFDEWWKNQIAALRAVPANPQIEVGESGRAGVDYSKITFDNVDGAKIRAQIARPTVGAKFPAIVVTQWAGIYGLRKDWITNRAAEGWLVINVMPHDLPIDQPDEFYKAQGAGPLKDYWSIGNQSRATSYFRRMFLGNVRATDYLAARPDWDGKTLVATGGSQGGYQSVVLAGLDARFTAVIADVPAGCDLTARSAGRAGGWPGWWPSGSPETRAAEIETSRYFDTINFASRVRVPVLVGMGLIDVTCPPAGVFAMTNQLKGSKEVIVMPQGGHQGNHADYSKRSNEWFTALRTGQKP